METQGNTEIKGNGSVQLSSLEERASELIASCDADNKRCCHPARIAVVGSGIAGLSAAYILTNSPLNHRVVVYEASSNLGMDSHGFDLPPEFAEPGGALDTGLPTRVDVPLRVFTESYYPHLTGLYNNVGVVYQPENYESSFTDSSGHTIFAYNNCVVKGFSLPYLLPWPIGSSPFFSLDFWRITRDILKFYYQTPKHLTNGRLKHPTEALKTQGDKIPFIREATVSLAQSEEKDNRCDSVDNSETFLEYLTKEGYSNAFIYRFMLPIVAAICTCSHHSAGQYPAWVIVQYLVTRAWKGVRRVRGGARDVVSKLVSKCEAVHLNSPVEKLIVTKVTNQLPNSDESRTQQKIILKTMSGKLDAFDHVIFASQANQTLHILNNSEDRISDTIQVDSSLNEGQLACQISDELQKSSQSAKAPANQLRSALARIPYETSRLVLHTDPALMPMHQSDWRSVNIILPESTEVSKYLATTPLGSPERLDSPRSDVAVAISPTNEAVSLRESGADSETSAAEPSAGGELGGARAAGLTTRQWVYQRQIQMEQMEAEGMATIWMNRVQHGLNPSRNIFQTWNPIQEPSPGTLLAQTSFERPVVTHDSLDATKLLWDSQGEQGIWCVGSYSLCGVPLLETAVASAVKVGDAFGADCPWRSQQVDEDTQRAQGQLPPSNSSKLIRWGVRAAVGTGLAFSVAFAVRALRGQLNR